VINIWNPNQNCQLFRRPQAGFDVDSKFGDTLVLELEASCWSVMASLGGVAELEGGLIDCLHLIGYHALAAADTRRYSMFLGT